MKRNNGKLYNKAHNQGLDLKEPQLSDFYKPSTSQKQGEMIYVGGMALALGSAASRFVEHKMERKLSGIWYGPKGFWRELLSRGWLKKPEFLRTLQSFG